MKCWLCIIVGRRKMEPDGVNWNWAPGALKFELWSVHRLIITTTKAGKYPTPTWKRIL